MMKLITSNINHKFLREKGPFLWVEGNRNITFVFDDEIKISFRLKDITYIRYILEVYHNWLGYPFRTDLSCARGAYAPDLGEDLVRFLDGKTEIRIFDLTKGEIFHLESVLFYVVRPKKSPSFFLNRALEKLK